MTMDCVCACCCSVTTSPSHETPWTVAHQAPLSMGFPGQEYWSGFRGLNPSLSHLLHQQAASLPLGSTKKPKQILPDGKKTWGKGHCRPRQQQVQGCKVVSKSLWPQIGLNDDKRFKLCNPRLSFFLFIFIFGHASRLGGS